MDGCVEEVSSEPVDDDVLNIDVEDEPNKGGFAPAPNNVEPALEI